MIKGLTAAFFACLYGIGWLSAQNASGGLPLRFLGTFEGPVLVYPGSKTEGNRYTRQISIYPSANGFSETAKKAYFMTFISTAGYEKHFDTLTPTVEDSAAGMATITGYDSLKLPARFATNYHFYKKSFRHH